jgi:hypothetical protein
MNDDLVKRLRDLNDHMNTFILDEAADRIEQLEAALREIMELGYWDVNVGKALKIARKALEGKDD